MFVVEEGLYLICYFSKVMTLAIRVCNYAFESFQR
jgi:hypothetical protein